jgi:hypothetical protein
MTTRLASRMSYLLWLSIPDEKLTRLAAAGTLRAWSRSSNGCSPAARRPRVSSKISPGNGCARADGADERRDVVDRCGPR